MGSGANGCTIEVNNTNIRYLAIYNKTTTPVLYNLDSDDVKVFNYPYISFVPTPNPTFDPSGYVYSRDVDNSTAALPGANVTINATVNTTNATGYYEFIGLGGGTYNATASKGGAYSTQEKAISGAGNDFTINFSKPFISVPYQENNYLKGKFSHNFKSVNLWETPNFVWGLYNYTDTGTIYTKACVYAGSNIFQCDYVKNTNYSFQFKYSDMYNYNLALYHPTLMGTRNFTSGLYYVQKDNIIGASQLSKLPQAQRESSLKSVWFDAFLWLALILVIIMVLSVNKPDRKYMVEKGLIEMMKRDKKR